MLFADSFLKKFRRTVPWFFSLFLLGACASTKPSLRKQAKDDLIRQDFVSAEAKLLSPEVVGESKSRLLTWVELGTVAHYQGQFEKSSRYFVRAKELAKRLYTKSVSEAALTALFNANASTYEGMEYELSFVHYYLTLNYLLLSQSKSIPAWELAELRDGSNVVMEEESHPQRELSEKEQIDFLTMARAEALDWDSYLQVVRYRNRGKPFYKDDLLNKLIGAFVHRKVDRVEDRNIAKLLYQNAEELLLRSSSSYPTFNKKFEQFIDHYDKFEKLGEQAVREQFLEATPEYSRTLKSIDEDLKRLKKNEGNVLVVFEAGTVPEKREKVYTIGLSTLFSSIEDPQLRRSVEQLGFHVILEVAPEIGLPLVATAVVGSAGAGPNTTLTGAVDRVVGIEYRLPEIPLEPIVNRYSIELGKKNESKEQVPIAVVQPVSDIAYMNVKRRAAAVAAATGIRVGLKYLAVLAAAVATYQKIDGPKFLKVLAAGAVWASGKALVDATERADIRAWNMLPKWIGVAEAQLPPGEYEVTAKTEGGFRQPMGTLSVNGKDRYLLKTRLFSPPDLGAAVR